ncbi:MAG: hypothetical protein Q9210_003986 [Variospora velana]
MVGQTVIDLSLSTDDEGPREYSRPSNAALSTHKESSYGSLSPSILVHDDGPRKKRKLSPVIRLQREPASNRSSFRPIDYLSSLPPVATKDASTPILDDDPIVWTSSPKPERPTQQLSLQNDKDGWASLSDSDESLPDERWLRTAQQRPAQNSSKIHGTTNLKSRDHAPQATGLSPNCSDERRVVPPLRSRMDSLEDDGTRGISKRPTGGKPKATDQEKAIRALKKQEARATAKAVKEHEKERKLLLKEERAREKQKEKDRAEANKLKLDKKLSTPEMIVDLPVSIQDATVETQIREMLRQIGVEVVSYDSPIPNVIKWRRKVDYRFDARSNCREKLRVQEIDSEKHVMCMMSADELADLVASDSTSGGGQGLNEHVTRMKRAFGDCKLIYMFEGLDIWMRKSRNVRNRAYTAAVRGESHTQGSEKATSSRSTATTSKRKQQRTEVVVDEDTIEDALLRLQVVHNCLIHHAAASVETAEWVAHFTEQISQIPYRYILPYPLALILVSISSLIHAHLTTKTRQEQTARDAAFCMDAGQVKSGKDAEEVYINMLLANVRVTLPIAHGIAAKFRNVSALVRGLKEKGPLALENIKV